MRLKPKTLVLKPTGAHSVATDFIRVYTKTFKETKLPDRMDPKRVLTLRASQLPFCPVDFFVQLANWGLGRQMDMGMAYYVSVGSTVHEVMQRYLGTTKRFLADWRCPVCGKVRRMTHEPYCCNVLSEYQELLIDHKGMVGHIDGVYKDANGDYWILDFKTTSTFAAPKKQKDPGRVYIEQIEAYALFLKLQYGIRVKGVMLVFIKRDNPNMPVIYSREITDDDLKAVRTRFKTYKKAHRDAIDTQTKAEALALLDYGKCKDPDCPTCKMGKEGMRMAVLSAYKRGTVAGRLPLRVLAETELKAGIKRALKHKKKLIKTLKAEIAELESAQ